MSFIPVTDIRLLRQLPPFRLRRPQQHAAAHRVRGAAAFEVAAGGAQVRSRLVAASQEGGRKNGRGGKSSQRLDPEIRQTTATAAADAAEEAE